MKFKAIFNLGRLVDLVRQVYFKKKYDLYAIDQEENTKFCRIGLDRAAGYGRLDAALKEIGSNSFDDLSGVDSVHWLIFSALSLSERGNEINRILEIGTFRGKTALLLKILFPNADITTVDLPISDPIMTATYRRDTSERLQEYLTIRDNRIKRAGIELIEVNSFFVPAVAPGPFDLVWIDAGHLYPEVAWDFCNAWHACRPGGIIMCDDIIPDPKGTDTYSSDAAYNIINYITERSAIKPLYFLKRRNPEWSADPRKRKFVAWIERPY